MKEWTKETKGKPHNIHDLIQETREAFMGMGFNEVENQVFIPEDDVYKQYGSEAPIILDRCYYLAGLTRPDIGLGKNQMKSIREISPELDFESFTKILREYREGSVEGDNLAEEMMNRLKIGKCEAMNIIDIIPEFKTITPVASRITLRSHMTAAWYPTLVAMQDTYELPLRLFSVGLRFRREQKVDATHLRVHYGASCVVMDNDFSLDDGKKLSYEILSKLRFENNKFVKKTATSNYYEENTEFEIYSDDIEIADCGMYSKVSLSNYGIKYPVFNLGFGLERILMVRRDEEDIRRIMYPQFYRVLNLSDEEIAENVKIKLEPKTEEGKKLVELLKKYAEKYGNEKSPCRFLVYSGSFLGKNISIYLIEKEENTKLLGPAAFNEVYVYEGGVYGIPRDAGKLAKKLDEVKEKGIYAGFSYLDAVLNLFAAGIEEFIRKEKKEAFFQVKMAKTPADVNITVGKAARRFITSKNKGIYVKGPVFTALEVNADAVKE